MEYADKEEFISTISIVDRRASWLQLVKWTENLLPINNMKPKISSIGAYWNWWLLMFSLIIYRIALFIYEVMFFCYVLCACVRRDKQSKMDSVLFSKPICEA